MRRDHRAAAVRAGGAVAGGLVVRADAGRTQMKVKVDGKDMSADELMAYIERLEAVVEAAREVFSEFENVDTSVKQMLRLNDLQRAIAALDAD